MAVRTKFSVLPITPVCADVGRQCAAEGGTCACTGSVKYGAGGEWSAYKTVAGSVTCSKSVFGDPSPTAVKVCMCETTALTKALIKGPTRAPSSASGGTNASAAKTGLGTGGRTETGGDGRRGSVFSEAMKDTTILAVAIGVVVAALATCQVCLARFYTRKGQAAVYEAVATDSGGTETSVVVGDDAVIRMERELQKRHAQEGIGFLCNANAAELKVHKRVLGEGAFGSVVVGQWKHKKVAVKRMFIKQHDLASFRAGPQNVGAGTPGSIFPPSPRKMGLHRIR